MTPLRHATALETVRVNVPEHAVEAFEAALATGCGTVGFFLDEDTGVWTLEGVRDMGHDSAALDGALALAALVTGTDPVIERSRTEAEGWLERTLSTFPEQLVGRRFAVRGTHLSGPLTPGRITLRLDAAVAFGSGEHGSTRGCLRALEGVRGRPRNIVDIGTGTGILAMAAARLFRRKVRATDIDPWSVRVAAANAALNGLSRKIVAQRQDGWRGAWVRGGRPYDLVLANILARPLTRMARDLAAATRAGGTVILSGLLDSQARWVMSAHRRHGLMLIRRVHEGRWTTLVLSKRDITRV